MTRRRNDDDVDLFGKDRRSRTLARVAGDEMLKLLQEHHPKRQPPESTDISAVNTEIAASNPSDDRVDWPPTTEGART